MTISESESYYFQKEHFGLFLLHFRTADMLVKETETYAFVFLDLYLPSLQI